ncbi:sensor histidine kinase [Gracilibacillus alcaliphilus]|uniref:sensor histidine kinase n=1 Tax=Gracilibacillus alcaliphilus TaxID=1401441 RepID=UPI001958C0D5|nr:histidine kinase [Gracilibacillus alcaliphilus]MBM7675750.1 signal transduction histidine kinase [Gracilibacillus alcaliphilus]
MEPKKYEVWTPVTCTFIWRSLAILLLCIFWLFSDDSEAGVLLLLFLATISLMRWRIEMPAWTTIFDQVGCFIIAIFWPGAWFALAVPIFETMLKGKPWFILLSFLFLFMESQYSLVLLTVLCSAAVTGMAIYNWSQDVEAYKKEADRERRQRFELETFKRELLLANVQTAKVAELAERNRISKSLHDHVGHELTGAILALQAFEQLWKEDDPQAEQVFLKAKERFSESSRHLRETVRNMKPIHAMGLESFQGIGEQFNKCPVDWEIHGDTSKIPVYLWGILEPCLKEALTNVAHHTEATQVKVSLDISESIIRLSIFNDGVLRSANGNGIGLRNLRQRAESVGGSLSASVLRERFQLVCVLPLENDEKRLSET